MSSSDSVGTARKSLVTVVIPNFKDQSLILDCLDSLVRDENSKFEIIVVDCMSDGLGKVLKERYANRVRLIHLNSDVGVAEQRNLGFKNAAKESKYVLFLDNDAEVSEETILRLLKISEEYTQFSIFQPKIVSHDESKRTLEIGMASNIFGIPKPITIENVDPFFASGAAMLLRNDVMVSTGGFDSLLYFGAEELDLIWRARLLGHLIKPVPDAIVIHRTEGTRKRLGKDRLYLGLRNTIRMLIKNYGFPLNMIIASIFVLRSIVESAVLLFVSRSLGQFRDNVAHLAVRQNKLPVLVIKFVEAVVWNMINLEDTVLQHNRIQAMRTISDRSIISAMRKNDLIFLSPSYRFAF